MVKTRASYKRGPGFNSRRRLHSSARTVSIKWNNSALKLQLNSWPQRSVQYCCTCDAWRFNNRFHYVNLIRSVLLLLLLLTRIVTGRMQLNFYTNFMLHYTFTHLFLFTAHTWYPFTTNPLLLYFYLLRMIDIIQQEIFKIVLATIQTFGVVSTARHFQAVNHEYLADETEKLIGVLSPPHYAKCY